MIKLLALSEALTIEQYQYGSRLGTFFQSCPFLHQRQFYTTNDAMFRLVVLASSCSFKSSHKQWHSELAFQFSNNFSSFFENCLRSSPISDLLPVRILTTGKYFSGFQASVFATTGFPFTINNFCPLLEILVNCCLLLWQPTQRSHLLVWSFDF